MAVTCMMTAAYAKDAGKKYCSRYPVVLIHGFMGWGEQDAQDGSRLYWGYNLVDLLKSEGSRSTTHL